MPTLHCELNGPNLGRVDGKRTQRTHQVERLALAGLPRILAEADADPFAVLCRGVEQQLLDVARVGLRPHHIQ